VVERALMIPVPDGVLAGILHEPTAPAQLGVVLIVGGPQYRVGSHRQFVLLARDLCAAGFACLRFDYRGMGDSDGDDVSFEEVRPDLEAAIDALAAAVPATREVALWGLCDGASVAALYAPTDRRVTALILLNPWVRSEQTLAKSYLSEYYGRRLLEPAFWRKLLTGGVEIGASLRSFADLLGAALKRAPRAAVTTAGQEAPGSAPLPERLRRALVAFSGRTLLILSGRDLVAGEFRELGHTPEWRAWLAGERVASCQLDEADHTFSQRVWRDEVAGRCREFLCGLKC
jgi:exosortase A-associated hydrolase 1